MNYELYSDCGDSLQSMFISQYLTPDKIELIVYIRIAAECDK